MYPIAFSFLSVRPWDMHLMDEGECVSCFTTAHTSHFRTSWRVVLDTSEAHQGSAEGTPGMTCCPEIFPFWINLKTSLYTSVTGLNFWSFLRNMKRIQATIQSWLLVTAGWNENLSRLQTGPSLLSIGTRYTLHHQLLFQRQSSNSSTAGLLDENITVTIGSSLHSAIAGKICYRSAPESSKRHSASSSELELLSVSASAMIT